MRRSYLQSSSLLTLAILLAGIGWMWLSRAQPGSTSAGAIPVPRAGFHAPDFTLQTPDGQSFSLSELRGRPVLVNLWASWCPPCRAEMPAMQRVYESYADQGFIILAINATNQDEVLKAVSFAQDYGLTFPILLDTDGSVGRQYQLRSLPTSFFINQQGVIEEVIVGGPMAEALLRIRVEQLLSP